MRKKGVREGIDIKPPCFSWTVVICVISEVVLDHYVSYYQVSHQWWCYWDGFEIIFDLHTHLTFTKYLYKKVYDRCFYSCCVTGNSHTSFTVITKALTPHLTLPRKCFLISNAERWNSSCFCFAFIFSSVLHKLQSWHGERVVSPWILPLLCTALHP